MYHVVRARALERTRAVPYKLQPSRIRIRINTIRRRYGIHDSIAAEYIFPILSSTYTYKGGRVRSWLTYGIMSIATRFTAMHHLRLIGFPVTATTKALLPESSPSVCIASSLIIQ